MSGAFVRLHSVLVSVKVKFLDLKPVLCEERMDVVLSTFEMNIREEDIPVVTDPAWGFVQEVLVLSKFTWSAVSLTIVSLLASPILGGIILSLRL